MKLFRILNDRKWSLLTAFAACCAVSNSAVGSPPSVDGNWAVEVKCSAAPDGAKPFTWRFSATVRGGALNGQFGQSGHPNSGTLSGNIDNSGNATLTMTGQTGGATTTFKHPTPGTPFVYTVNAHFDAKYGTGKRNEQRDCSLNFKKQ